MIAAALLLAVLSADPAVVVPPAETVPAAEVVGMEKGKPASFDGILVTPGRFEAYLNLQKKLTEAEARNAELQSHLKDCLVKCEGCKPPEGSSFHKTSFTVGMVVGGVVTIAVTAAVGYGVYELVKLAK